MEAVEDIRMRHRVVTEFMTTGYSPKDTHRCLRSMCGEDAKDISSVRGWVHHFNSSGKNNGNRPHSDPSATAVIMQTTDRVDAMILNYCITACELQAAVGDWKTRSWQQKNLSKIGAENCY